MRYQLDKYEKEIEDNFSSQSDLPQEMDILTKAAKSHVKNKKSITIRLAQTDIEAIKIKASKCGIPYQTYINMLIHLDASKL